MKIARFLPDRARMAPCSLAQGTHGAHEPRRAQVRALALTARGAETAVTGKKQSARSKGEPRRHTPSCAIRTAPGPGEWDQGDENTGVILLRSDRRFGAFVARGSSTGVEEQT